MSTARVVDNPEKNRYEIYQDDELAGYVTYKLDSGQIAFLHTELDPAFAGRGLGSVLVKRVLADARERGLGVLPYCPFVRGYIEKHPEYLDLVPEDRRTSEFKLAAS